MSVGFVYQMAWNHGRSRAVLRVDTRALFDVYAHAARAFGVPGGTDRQDDRGAARGRRGTGRRREASSR